jgi:hypothetical protein
MPLKDYEIIAYESVGPLKLGASRDEITSIIGPTDDTQSVDNTLIDSYFEEGLTIHYDAAAQYCKAIAMMSPAYPTYQGQALMNQPWMDIVGWFTKIDSNVELIDIGLIGYDTGIDICRGYVSTANGYEVAVVNVVGIFRPGYWEAYDPDAVRTEVVKTIAEAPSEEEVWEQITTYHKGH